MNFKDAKSLSEFDNDALYTALTRGVRDEKDLSHLMDLYKDTTKLHYSLFDDDIFIQKKNISEDNPDGNNLLEYILPSVTRVYSKFFINPPSIFSNSNFLPRLELFQLQFNLQEFLIFLSKKFKSNHNCLSDFENLDTDSEILTLIVEDYVASKVSFVTSINNSEIQKEIRNIKISKHLEI